MKPKPRRWRILHLHASFAAGAQAMRAVQLINAFGPACAHGIVSADGRFEAAGGIDRGITVDLAADYPDLTGRPAPARLQRLARAAIGHDLVLTYGYSAIDAAMAHTLFGGNMPLPPLVHHEDEPGALNRVGNWYRRIGLGRAAALIVPSRRLEAIAVDVWQQPRGRVRRIAPGIRTAAYAARPRRDALPRVIKRDGELWLGAVAGLTPLQDAGGLLRAFAALPEPWQLVILGDGVDRDAVRDEALRLGLGHRVHMPGAVAEPARVMGLFDLFTVISASDPAPISVIAAMAAGLAVAAADAADAAAMLAPENRPFVVAPGDEAGLAAALRALAETPGLRARVGAANRALARAEYDEAQMVAAYRAVYGAALGQDDFA